MSDSPCKRNEWHKTIEEKFWTGKAEPGQKFLETSAGEIYCNTLRLVL
jgi:hypothetical protein